MQQNHEDDKSAICDLLTTSMCREAMKKNSNNSLKYWKKTAAEYGMEINSDRSKILINSIKSGPSNKIRMNGKALEEVDQFKYLGSTESKDGISIREVKIRRAQAYLAMTRLAMLWKTTPSVFLQRLNSTSHLSLWM